MRIEIRKNKRNYSVDLLVQNSRSNEIYVSCKYWGGSKVRAEREAKQAAELYGCPWGWV